MADACSRHPGGSRVTCCGQQFLNIHTTVSLCKDLSNEDRRGEQSHVYEATCHNISTVKKMSPTHVRRTVAFVAA